MISVIDGDIPTTYATFESVEDAMSKDMWQITVQLIHCPSQKLATPMEEPTLTTMTSTPLWRPSEKLRYVDPGAQIYEGVNVTILFLSHIFFLILIVCCPYFCFAPQHEEINYYLLTFDLLLSPLIFTL